MFSKREIKQMKKGFYPSRTGKSPNAIVGKDRFLAFAQRIEVIDKRGLGSVIWVEHMINISKPNC